MSRWTFLREFVREPTRLGSVTPSSRPLAELVAETAQVRPGKVIVELGEGTGPITRALRERHPDAALLAFEPNHKLAVGLRRKFADLDVVESFADRHLPDVLAAWGHDRVDCVVSGLPWTMWSDAEQDEVFRGITAALAPSGRFLTYTYVNSQLSSNGRRFRRTLRRWFGRVSKTKVMWANVPPALVLVGDAPIRR